MALITEFEEVSGNPRESQSQTRAVYQTFRSTDGETYLQIETVGTKDREVKGATSQTIRLNRRGMLRLIEILARALQKA
jgi:hypothetical protein